MDASEHKALGFGTSVSEEALAESRDRVRALVLHRLEMVWDTVKPHLDGSIQEEGLRPDPRMVETGIRVLDRVAKFARLLEPAPAAEPSDPSLLVAADRIAVERSLLALEARMRAEAG